jgi:hypothetical protein
MPTKRLCSNCQSWWAYFLIPETKKSTPLQESSVKEAITNDCEHRELTDFDPRIAAYPSYKQDHSHMISGEWANRDNS